MIQKSYNNSSSLYLVPTPIGNLEDMTFRAINVLSSVDIILCEDTRESLKLLKYYNITKKLVSCHEYNEEKLKDYVLSMLKDNKNIALISDQGTPIVSDPGFIVSKYIIENGFNVISLPGATAFVPALTSSGLFPSKFLFYGFLNSKSSKRKEELMNLFNLPYSIIFYESPHRLIECINDMLSIFGNRKISISREISKIHEEIYRGTLSDFLISDFKIKGEFVIILDGNYDDIDYNSLSIIEHVNLYLDEMSEMDAIKKVSKERSIAKSIVYKEYHDNKNG